MSETQERYTFDTTELKSISEGIDLANKISECAGDLIFEVSVVVKTQSSVVLGRIDWDEGGFIGFVPEVAK